MSARLENKDFTIIIDRSGSMGTRLVMIQALLNF